MTFPEWVHQSVVKIVCPQSEHVYVNICKSVGYHPVKQVGAV